jgi:small redox-active disulfide protein 2
MIIKILGTGCSKCKQLEELVLQVVSEYGMKPDIQKINDIPGIMAYGVMQTPGLVVDEQLRASGRIPTKKEILGWLQAGP